MAHPLSGPGQPLAVPFAIIGIPAATLALALLYIDFYSDDRFEAHSTKQQKMTLGRDFYADIMKFSNTLRSYANHTAKDPTVSRQENNDIMRGSMATLSAVHAIEGHYADLAGDVWTPVTKSFPGISASRLLFLLTCFMKCGSSGRSHFLKKVYCNVALPAVPSFRRAFQCRPGDHLVTNFTWREAAH